MQVRLKYAADRILALAVLVAVMPLLLLIAFAVKLQDGGPVLFRQARVGERQKLFEILKFRTMIENADARLEKDGSVACERVTRFGRVLRRWSLDELPQLFNIVRGEMSFVGPRPVVPEHVRRYTERHKRRFFMRPGITGLAQVNGRNTIPWTQRLEFDCTYVDSYRLTLDIAVLARTVIVVAFRKGIVLDRNPQLADDLPAARAPAAEEA
jgi:lipopolysaccharide/colanic/teichoic acid biosynthesis glycosyltransferase